MLFKSRFKEDEDPDFFDGPDIPEKPKEPKKPRLTPDNPAFWEEEESEFAHLLPHHPHRHIIWVWLGVSLLAIALIIGFTIRFGVPYSTDNTQFGYVENIRHEGNVFKTYEGVLLPYKELHDTTRIYRRDFLFSVADKEVALKLRERLDKGAPVKVTYSTYHASLPWRGARKIIVTAVDSVDPRTILPPELAPKEEPAEEAEKR